MHKNTHTQRSTWLAPGDQTATTLPSSLFFLFPPLYNHACPHYLTRPPTLRWVRKRNHNNIPVGCLSQLTAWLAAQSDQTCARACYQLESTAIVSLSEVLKSVFVCLTEESGGSVCTGTERHISHVFRSCFSHSTLCLRSALLSSSSFCIDPGNTFCHRSSSLPLTFSSLPSHYAVLTAAGSEKHANWGDKISSSANVKSPTLVYRPKNGLTWCSTNLILSFHMQCCQLTDHENEKLPF